MTLLLKIGDGLRHGSTDRLRQARLAVTMQGFTILGYPPECFQRAMHQGSTGTWIKPFNRLFDSFRTKTKLEIAPGRANRLGTQQPGAAGDFFTLGNCRRQRISHAFHFRPGGSYRLSHMPGQTGRLGNCAITQADASQQRAGPQQACAIPTRMGKNDLRRRTQQTRLDPVGKIEFNLGAGMCDLLSTQQFRRQQRIRARRRRPDIIADADHPKRVKTQAGAFEHTEHLN